MLKGSTYAVFITGQVNVNTTINTEPVRNTNEAFDVTVDFEVTFANTAPKVAGLARVMEIFPDLSKVYVVGSPYDMQLDTFYLEEWGFGGSI